ncbi:hypothetical protein MUY27_08135 [Mucilaginibacter sp. RS28]|uniref:Uncharacterized protein n=1 Tax=Mucilaginibacter straminoryzae TaxID=2932774 RepID=A0A9X1X6R8_9SPHI|nr:hypothetical protein [Mucilaginibacter straminoryzae]MCJ8209674.1 hypothetical protein [Mucilaginibacter straminoryzae]
MQKTLLKYRIDELLGQLSVRDYRKAQLLIPQILNVSSKTFSNYRKIKFDDKQDIPHEKVVLLEKLFALGPGELQNFFYDIEPIKTLGLENQPAPQKIKRKSK